MLQYNNLLFGFVYMIWFVDLKLIVHVNKQTKKCQQTTNERNDYY